MKIENIEKTLIVTWNYLGWKNWDIQLGYPQRDWAQTLMTRINEISASIHMRSCVYDEKTKITSELGPADTIIMNEHCFEIIKSLEFFNVENSSLVSKKVIVDNTIDEDVIFVLRKDIPDDYEKKNMTAGAIKIENY
jgi:hypothetical protein